MQRPPVGLCLPCRIVKVRDGDTIEVSLLGSQYAWAVRLMDCWCAERNTAAGKAAKAFAEEVVAGLKHVHVWIPSRKHTLNLLRFVSFDRFIGHVFISDIARLSERMVCAGHATKEKPKGTA